MYAFAASPEQPFARPVSQLETQISSLPTLFSTGNDLERPIGPPTSDQSSCLIKWVAWQLRGVRCKLATRRSARTRTRIGASTRHLITSHDAPIGRCAAQFKFV